MQVFTQNDLVRFIYNEMNETEKAAMEVALKTNPSLFRLYEDLKAVTEKIGKPGMEPDDSTIALILEHSATTSHLETSH